MVTEKLADKIERLTIELEIAKHKMASCKHEFSKPVPAAREIDDPIFVGYKGYGSDPIPVYKNHTKLESGWERTCGTCGYKEYTNRTKATQVGPDFGG
ncbi:MAG: hypothetical protein JSW73_00570 [Candidatus Woesearchaeota archaeon]|nr:MAG: hypothetical protein JSW73_00570 [Candidatus Woesearchaeota archaeon]